MTNINLYCEYALETFSLGSLDSDDFASSTCTVISDPLIEFGDFDNDDTYSVETRFYHDTVHFSCDYLCDRHDFMSKILSNVNVEESDKLIEFSEKILTNPYYDCASILDNITKRIFGPKYLANTELTSVERRNRRHQLEKRFFAIFARHMLLKEDFTMSKERFLRQFGDLIIAHSRCRGMDSDSELELLFRYLAPVLVWREKGRGFCKEFFNRRMSIIESLGEFMQYTPERHYCSGGGKTPATLLREACLDRITGNVRRKRNRSSRRTRSHKA